MKEIWYETKKHMLAIILGRKFPHATLCFDRRFGNEFRIFAHITFKKRRLLLNY